MAVVKPAPLNASFMLTAILGFLISVIYVRKLDESWAFAFAVVFVIMIIASLISMVEAPVRGQLVPRLEREFRSPYVGKPAKRTAKKSSRKKKR